MGFVKFTFIKFVKNPLTEITINIPINNREIYCKQERMKERNGVRTKLHNPANQTKRNREVGHLYLTFL